MLKGTGESRERGLLTSVPEGRVPRQALLEIEVTDAKWIQHMKKGQTWDSAPFDMEEYV